MDFLRVAGAQLNLTVGDIDGNGERIREAMAWAEGVDADVLLLPELAITGYPPEDLLLRDAFVAANLEMLEKLARRSDSVVTVVGFVDRAKDDRPARLDDAVDRHLANAAALLAGGRVEGIYHKGLLPNYGVFDEDRYFVPAARCDQVWRIGSVSVGVSVCEDIWVPDGPPSQQAAAGAQILLNINASPFHEGKGAERERLIAAQAVRSQAPVVYLNLVGGQDELVFDGESMVVDAAGVLRYRAPAFEEQLFWVDVPVPAGRDAGVPVGSRPARDGEPAAPPAPAAPIDDDEAAYRALVVGLRDYVAKNGFSEAVIGLSGGIDSALTAAVAADALGPAAVLGVTMPSRYSSRGSVEDSRDLAERLGIRFEEVDIEPVFGAYLDVLADSFAGTAPGVAEENLQARIRGAVLMALSNKFGGIVVATGNKSELAVGYATLYGDMAGGYAVLKDVFKTQVYELARWRNRAAEVIPLAIIDKAPSAELRPDQKDSDSLPPYDELDPILERYIEADESPEQIVAAGFPALVVHEVAAMVDRNEYKRRQAAPGVKISRKAFGKDRRLPITNGWRT